ncbi:CPBP family intramembrane metalloprotease [Gemmatimonadales bacterium]|nr:CPBP family intramembrane metalloprotease [Gemmatimonadales bacterium]
MILLERLIKKCRVATVVSGRVPTLGAAVLFIALVAVAFFSGGGALQVLLYEPGLLVAEWLFLFVPAVAFVVLGGFDPVQTLLLRRPSARQVGASVLVIAGASPLVWGIGWLQAFVLPVPWELLEGMEDLVTAETATRLLWLLILLAFTPAICEEIVFRGVLLSGTLKLDPWRIILLNGFVFGVFHLSFATATRFLPTALLGMVITWSVWRTGSMWIGVLMHFINNGAIVFLASIPALKQIVFDPEMSPSVWFVFVSVMIFSTGVRLLKSVSAPPVFELEASEPVPLSPEAT